ncbi:MAG: rhodanese-like domain-containing protein [Gammaproteobacteria bacterium]|nr:rhodanese-like domain-containing protein [Gammaproteobacteria bacterium]
MENIGEFILNHWVLSSLFVVLAWLVLSDSLHRKLSGIAVVGVTDAVKLVNQNNGLFLDVREQSEFDKEHIADSKHIPGSQLSEKAEIFKDKQQPLILVCANGQRSKTAAKELKKAGFTDVYVLTGGLNSWKEAKLPLFS